MPQENVDVTFHNVTVTVNAKDPKQAYALLCEALSNIECEYYTDTYEVESKSGSVRELWPDGEYDVCLCGATSKGGVCSVPGCVAGKTT